MKTEDANKTISTIFTSTDKSLLLFSVFLNRQLNSRKHQNISKIESETLWIQLNYSIHADHTLLHLENITSLINLNLPMIHLVTIQEEWLDIDNQVKALYITLIILLTAVSGTLVHQWNMKTILKQKTLKKIHDDLINI